MKNLYLTIILGAGFFIAGPVNAETHIVTLPHSGKHVIIDNRDRSDILTPLGMNSISGRIANVGHDHVDVETGDGRYDVDLGDIDFDASLDSVFHKDMSVTVYGEIKSARHMEAHSISGSGTTYESRKPLRYYRH